jgi:hypothetical protein
MLSFIYAGCHMYDFYAESCYAECQNAECYYAKCHGAILNRIIMLIDVKYIAKIFVFDHLKTLFDR